ncbi:MAG TPA: PhzF family phenazine biosynthesis protein [Acidimicrobiales bacterium]|nr:PhzF family phenazine biosynthesis protein [Acidimicrobiales bacterium]
MRQLRYRIVDVFTDRPFSGNPLAIVLDAEGLSSSQLLALAREFNLSETAFPLPGFPAADYALRIFMPGKELPFAGHPSVGAAWVMATEGRVAMAAPSTTVHMACGAGVLPLEISVAADGRVDVITLTAWAPSVGPPLDPTPVLAGLGLGRSDLAPDRAFRICSTGLPQAFLCVEADAVGRVVVDAAVLGRAAAEGGWETVSVFSWSSVAGSAHTRVFADGLGWGEDPATGSAASALGAWLAAEGLVRPSGRSTYVVRQGLEIGRDSSLFGTVDTVDGVARLCQVAGRVVPVASGEIEVPR